jgi:hypothetical protein
MLVALLLPVLIGLFLLAMEGFETRVCKPRGQDSRTLTWDRGLRPLGSAVTAMHPAACLVATSEAQFHGDRHNGNGADIDRQGPRRPIGGRGPWTHR